MSVSYSITGGLVHLSGNPIQIVLTASAPKNNHRTAVKVKCNQLISAEQIDEREPISLVSQHNIQGLVDEPLPIDFHFPVVGVASAHAALVLDVSLEVGEVWTDENGDRQEAFTPIAETLRVIDGRLWRHELAVLNEAGKSFASEYIEGGKFLTSQPNNQKVSLNQYAKLWYLSRWTDNHPCTLFTKINTSLKIAHIPIQQPIVLYTNTGLLELSLNPILQGFQPRAGDPIESYEVWLEDSGGEVSEKRTFVVDNNYHEVELYGFYRNKFSAVDSFWFSGEIKEAIKTESETAYMAVAVGAGTKSASIKTVSVSGQRVWEINSGFMNRGEMLALREFIESKERWIIDPDNATKLIPVYLESGDFSLYSSMDDLQNIDFKLIEAHV